MAQRICSSQIECQVEVLDNRQHGLDEVRQLTKTGCAVDGQFVGPLHQNLRFEYAAAVVVITLCQCTSAMP